MTKAFIFPSSGLDLESSMQSFCDNSKTFKEYTQTNKLFYQDTEPVFLKHITLINGMLKTLKEDFKYNINKQAKFLAGHSIGEFNTVAASGMVPFQAIFKIIRKAEESAKNCIKKDIFSSIALINTDIYKAYDLCLIASGNEICQVACHNNENIIIVSGHKNAIERLRHLSKKYGVQRIININFELPFHCQLMQPVAETINLAMQKVHINEPKVPVVFNYSAKTEKRPGYVKSLLFSQICHTVLWKDSVDYMLKNGVNHFVEIGPGNYLTQMIQRISPKSTFSNIRTIEEMENFVKQKNNFCTPTYFKLE